MRTSRRAAGIAITTLGLATIGFGAVAAPAGATPQRGTVKVGDPGATADVDASNDPKIETCSIEVQWFGFAGATDATLTFEMDHAVIEELDVALVATDELDGDVIVDLHDALDGHDAGNDGSYLVKLTVATEQANGQVDRKSKVLHVAEAGCLTQDDEPVVGDDEPVVEDDEPVVEDDEPVVEDDEPVVEDDEPVVEDDEPVVEDDEPVVEDDEPVVTTEQQSGEQPTTPEVPAVVTEVQNDTSSPRVAALGPATREADVLDTAVLGVQIRRTSLARTGAPVAPMTILAIGCLLLGAGALLLGDGWRRRLLSSN